MSTTLITKVSSIPYPYASQKSPRVHNLSPTHLTIVEFLSPPGYLCSCRVSSFPALYPPLLQATPSYLPPSVPAGTAPTRVPCDRPVSPLPWASAALLPSSSTGGPTLPPVVIVHRKSPLYIMSQFPASSRPVTRASTFSPTIIPLFVRCSEPPPPAHIF